MSSAGLSGSSAVGIIVNPNAGKDIRRLTSASGQTSDAVKIGIMRRAAVGALEMGADRILFSSDTHHLAERAVEGLDGCIEFLDTPLTGSQLDTVAAARTMWKEQVGAVIALGGDGTCRDVATGWPDVPLIAISTGTNNVFPSAVDGTTAGVAAALVATGAVPVERVSRQREAGRAAHREPDVGGARACARRGRPDRHRVRRRPGGQRPDIDPMGRRVHRQSGEHRPGQHRRARAPRRSQRTRRGPHPARQSAGARCGSHWHPARSPRWTSSRSNRSKRPSRSICRVEAFSPSTANGRHPCRRTPPSPSRSSRQDLDSSTSTPPSRWLPATDASTSPIPPMTASGKRPSTTKGHPWRLSSSCPSSGSRWRRGPSPNGSPTTATRSRPARRCCASRPTRPRPMWKPRRQADCTESARSVTRSPAGS